ncbi:MAG TPA: hypothetical protein PK072_15570, partial [Quisquiliibacterium sp.]|nr:hypothetical protein [Quisquiliibacterium sp.]
TGIGRAGSAGPGGRADAAGSVGVTGRPAVAGVAEAPGATGAPCTPGPDVPQPAAIRAIADAARIRGHGGRRMWVVYLEAAGILLLVLFFVWWTMRGK